MIKIDAHQYFWNRKTGIDKLLPAEFNLNEAFLSDQTISETRTFDIEGCIAIQSRQFEAENSFLLELSNQYSFIKGVVGWVDMHAPTAIDQLSYYTSHPKFLGIRYFVKDSDRKKLLTQNFKQTLSFLTERHLTLDLVCQPKHLSTLIELVSHFPEQKYILNDLGNPYIKEGILIPWADDIYKLSEFSNFSCKFPGLSVAAASKQKEFEEIIYFVSVVLQAFGYNRIIFGSDWQGSPAIDQYSEIHNLVERILEPFSEKEKRAIWGENALAIYGINKM